jgi:hypothetical protein
LDRGDYAARALRSYEQMRRAFATADGGYRRDGARGRLGARAHLWPLARAFVASLDLAGIDPALLGGFDVDGAIARDLAALERYWEPREPAAYASDPPGARFGGGDRYYDDNAWVGLGLVQLERLRPGHGRLDRAAQLWRFAQAGWDRARGGVFWVEQGRGLGRRNHDRNTVSSAPNAELGLHLAELGSAALGAGAPGGPDPVELYRWVCSQLQSPEGLFYDKLRGGGALDEQLWSYNQGSMIGAAVLLARAGDAGELARAEAIARAALDRYAGAELEHQPAEFNAILFRNLLLLHAATADRDLARRIGSTLRNYAEVVWVRGGGYTLLARSAVVTVHALLAWDSAAYARLA